MPSVLVLHERLDKHPRPRCDASVVALINSPEVNRDRAGRHAQCLQCPAVRGDNHLGPSEPLDSSINHYEFLVPKLADGSVECSHVDERHHEDYYEQQQHSARPSPPASRPLAPSSSRLPAPHRSHQEEGAHWRCQILGALTLLKSQGLGLRPAREVDPELWPRCLTRRTSPHSIVGPSSTSGSACR